jgi:cellulose synthase/poly-beta-1,6-N-acetylglucosamine synthase-like glycosyltransferase
VINDGSTDDTEDLLNTFCKQYPNLRTTFVPVGANNVSTKKLGLTLGIKAAKHDWLLFTDADCMPEDKNWITRMARNFTRQTDIVLGYGAYLNKKGFLNRLITYDTLFSGLQYLGMALAHKPYMGVGRNLAYRKETFFAHKGFASTLHLSSGDDDLMVNKASNHANTRVEIASDSITWSEPETRYKEWLFQKKRHLSVAPYYKSSTKLQLTIEPFMRGLFYATLILALVLGNMVMQIAAGVFFLARMIVQLIVINRSAKHFGDRRYFLVIPLFDIFLPLVSLYFFTFGRFVSAGRVGRWK